MLIFEIEFLTGVVVARRTEDELALDWPPQPDRVFSALVASWAARGKGADEKRALEWLERQQAPRIRASSIQPRSMPIVFVPPNDFRTTTVTNLDVLPERRRRQARHFPSGRPSDASVDFAWDASPDTQILACLDAIARDTSYVGHSISLTRCRFLIKADSDARCQPSRRIYPGRLEELERAFLASQRPSPGEFIVGAEEKSQVSAATSIFSDTWLVLEGDGGRIPDIRATPIVARKLRDAIMSAWPGPIPEWISGHDVNGKISCNPHLAFIPLADVGWEFSEGGLMGFALALPRGISPDIAVDDVGSALGVLVGRGDPDEGRIDFHYAPGACWHLRPTLTPQRASLRIGRYLGVSVKVDATQQRSARVWTTATPIALDRFPKSTSAEDRRSEVERLIVGACANIGLPAPAAIRAGVSSNLRGVPASAVPRKAPEWQRWQLPRSLAGRYLVHATMTFNEPIRGPVILGAGRFAGLGLCIATEPAQ